MLLGCISAGIYHNSTDSACQYFSALSKSEVIVLQDAKQMKKYETSIVSLTNLKAVVLWTYDVSDDVPLSLPDSSIKVYKWHDFLILGSTINNSRYCVFYR